MASKLIDCFKALAVSSENGSCPILVIAVIIKLSVALFCIKSSPPLAMTSQPTFEMDLLKNFKSVFVFPFEIGFNESHGDDEIKHFNHFSL